MTNPPRSPPSRTTRTRFGVTQSVDVTRACMLLGYPNLLGCPHTGVMGTTGALERGRLAARKSRWREAHSLLLEADATASLGLDDLELLALAAYLIGREDESTAAW